MKRTLIVLASAGLLTLATTGLASAEADDRTTVTGNATHGGQWRVEDADGNAQGPWRHDRAMLKLGGGWSIHVKGGATCRSVDWDGFNSGVISSAGVGDAYCYGWAGDEGF